MFETSMATGGALSATPGAYRPPAVYSDSSCSRGGTQFGAGGSNDLDKKIASHANGSAIFNCGHFAPRHARELDDLIDLICEAIAEHFIRLIKNEHTETGELEIAAICEIIDTTGRADDDLGSRADFTGIGMTGNTADREHHINLHMLRESTNHRGNLFGKLVGMGHYQSLGGLDGGIHTAQEANAEGTGLSGS
jgi:hypothetical protein